MDINELSKVISDDPDILREDFERAITAVKFIKRKIDAFLRKNPHKIPKEQMLFVVAQMVRNSYSEIDISTPKEEELTMDLLAKSYGLTSNELTSKINDLIYDNVDDMDQREAAAKNYSAQDWLRSYSKHHGMFPNEQQAAPTPQGDRGVESSSNPPSYGNINSSIEDLDLSVRSSFVLSDAGVKTIRDLTNKTSDELLSHRNFGMTSLKEVRRKLGKFGFSLKNEGGGLDDIEVVHH